MGIYLNPGNGNFRQAINSEIYVDKTGLISYINSVVNTKQKYVCVSRPRRFGKSMAAEMLAAYYDREADSRSMFSPYEIAGDESFERHLGKYDVVSLNMRDFLDKATVMEDMIALINSEVLEELTELYSFDYGTSASLDKVMARLHSDQGASFVILIDEWDCIFRVHKEDKISQEAYLNFLRNWLKDKEYIALAYMTGILPIKKYGTHSALNMFFEYSMTHQGPLAKYSGFTQDEVTSLCDSNGMDLENMESWYNGYRLSDRGKEIAIYSPRSVVTALMMHHYSGYWTETETYEALQIYIKLNYDGLRDAIISLLAGDQKKINITKYSNDMVTFAGFEDVLTLLIHLGYLGYDMITKEVFIPNKEIYDEFVNAVEDIAWGGEVAKAIRASEGLLTATWSMNAEVVANSVQLAHQETAHLTYNSETALSYTISLAYYAAREYYNIIREYPAGKGFADLVFIPKPNHPDKPAMIVELKCDKGADTAIKQIHEKQYPDAVTDYKDNLLLVGISYDKKTKVHTAEIERG
jgi:hypothetical protein